MPAGVDPLVSDVWAAKPLLVESQRLLVVFGVAPKPFCLWNGLLMLADTAGTAATTVVSSRRSLGYSLYLIGRRSSHVSSAWKALWCMRTFSMRQHEDAHVRTCVLAAVVMTVRHAETLARIGSAEAN